jgi:hypothetical protein
VRVRSTLNLKFSDAATDSRFALIAGEGARVPSTNRLVPDQIDSLERVPDIPNPFVDVSKVGMRQSELCLRLQLLFGFRGFAAAQCGNLRLTVQLGKLIEPLPRF